MTTFTLVTRTQNKHISATLQYFQCQKSGRNNTCSYDPEQFPAVTLASYLLLGLFPAVNLVCAVNIRETKAILNQMKTRIMGTPATIRSSEQCRTTVTDSAIEQGTE